ncbi:Heat shock protein DnaJ [Penicillium mononematosum]|uniref:Heat shock protein DnaJ n=1 Tax=Penicillium mononematosum TaxID=268346 RepID=UPI00254733AF|nr:Heat shock protein DnaJ [Penicillium mononematosum]KAJ6179360.1 Heat shock protein DnaJ [Penicillium mononematosum]
MPSASASGSDAKRGGATSRDHQQGNQDRKYTDDQKAAVLRIRKCQPTAFYEILLVERSATDNEIKKAYRKQSLLTHPDKNGYEGADEAFKMVSRAFQILSDEEKKSKYDKFGGDPDSRFQPGPSASSGASPFSGFGGGGFPRGGARFDEEVSAEEMFNRFFNGGFGGMGGGGFGGPQFVFNMGGGPGFRVHQFGGQAPRRRPRPAATEQEAQLDARSFLRQLLPLIILFILPLLSSLFSGPSTSSGPSYRFDTPSPRIHSAARLRNLISITFARNFRELDTRVEVEYVRTLRNECDAEAHERERRLQEAQGWLFPDVEKMKKARAMEMPSCRRLDQLKMKGRY